MDTHQSVIDTLECLSASLDERIERYEKTDSLPAVIQEASADGLLSLQDCYVIREVVRISNPTNTLEIGLASGSSALTIKSSSSNESHHTAIDPYQQQSFQNRAVKRISSGGFASRFKLIEDFSHFALPSLLTSKACFEFIFNDASHMFDYTLLEAFYCDKMMPQGGVMLFDDSPWPMVANVISFLKTNLDYHCIRLNDRLTACVKTENDDRKWYDYADFYVPADPIYLSKIRSYQAEHGTGLTNSSNSYQDKKGF
jgi:predicted O-methyltransferase YrrM